MGEDKEISFMPFLLVAVFFMGGNVLNVLHYPHADPFSSAIFRLHPSTYLLFGLLLIQNIKQNTFYHLKSPAVRYFGIVVFLVFVYSMTLGKTKANFFIIDTLLAPVLLVQLLQDASDETKQKLLYWLKFFFILNCLMAILERSISTIILRPASEAFFESFRSYGLLGHPLNNSLITAFLTLFFVIISDSTTKKFMFLGLGIMALFSFGGRTALAAVIFSFPFVLYFDLKNYETEEAAGKFFNYLAFFFLMIALCVFVLVSTPFGERIFASSKFDDDSADVRARVFDMFRHFKGNDLLLGIDEAKMINVMNLEKVDIIENFWIIWIFKYGFVMTAMLGLFLIRFLFSLFQNLDVPTRIILVLVFLTVASGNNSMANNTTAISIITLASIIGFEAYSHQTEEITTDEESIHSYSGI